MTKVRTPRQAVNTITALAVGGAVYFLAPLLGTVVDSRLVIMGGALHFAGALDGNNALGMDGPAMWTEVTAGADGRTLVWGKVRSSLMVMTIPSAVAGRSRCGHGRLALDPRGLAGCRGVDRCCGGCCRGERGVRALPRCPTAPTPLPGETPVRVAWQA
ncbi:MAG: hypothetical protein R2789_13065 [Microthrixaceae bacterium]